MNENEGEGDDAGEESFAFCYHCGAEMKTKVNICPNCGKEIDNSQ
jgi:predicted amidophosphoribosyltransferase